MSKVWLAIVETIKEVFYNIAYVFKINIGHYATLIEFLIPYVMYLLGQNLALERGYFGIGGELFIPFVCWVVIYFARSVANKLNRGANIPRPTKRFTQVDEDGMVSVDQNRLEELLVYTADLEDWMERKGWL